MSRVPQSGSPPQSEYLSKVTEERCVVSSVGILYSHFLLLLLVSPILYLLSFSSVSPTEQNN
ncbi:unnamed protein product [Wuchereria bancrofti]|uniref:Uncharacterized protein n=1 Tax=Wuchereria bancrofti TaxID=6293 RepID=A0A3P7DRS9_WUCBA|nr:unnamed protein product [Wuchereria bancrofti]